MTKTEKRKELSWREVNALHQEYMTTKEWSLQKFALSKGLDVAHFKREARGWRNEKINASKKSRPATPVSSDIQDAIEAIWWVLITEAGACLKELSEEKLDLKTLSTVAAIVKTAQVGLTSLMDFEVKSDEPAIIIEGIDIEKL